MAQLLSEKEKRIEEKKNVAEKGEEMLKIKIEIGNQIIIFLFFFRVASFRFTKEEHASILY
jgi:hypothetical protein